MSVLNSTHTLGTVTIVLFNTFCGYKVLHLENRSFHNLTSLTEKCSC